MTKALLLALAAALPLAGCESVVNVDPPAHTPRLSIAYTLSNQALTPSYQQFFDRRALYVSTSHSITEISRLVGRADATVELRDASGQIVEQFLPRGRGGYGSADSAQGYYVARRGYMGQPGQRYTLHASAPNVEPVEASLTLPAITKLEGGSFALDPTSNTYNYKGRLTFTIADNAATTDHYLAYGRVLDAAGQYWGQLSQDYGPRNDVGPDIKLTRFDLSQPGAPFQTLPVSDAGRNGLRLTYDNDVYMYYNVPYDPTNPTRPRPEPAFVEITVSSIPLETYDFYQSVQRYYDTDGNPFAEPAPLHSNVKAGYGLFAGATDVVLRIPL
jgi:hypothetical protein